MSEIVLQVKGLKLTNATQEINATIYESEIVGLAGLDGHGQEDFLEILGGVQKPVEGQIFVHKNGDSQPIKNMHHAVEAGVVYLPRNRKTQGILPSLSVFDNFGVATLQQRSWFGFLNKRRQHKRLEEFQEKLSMVYASPKAPITSLSGGNQQKVLLARWMASNPRVMLLNDPTRGVDLRTRLTLYDVFKDMARNEKTTLVVLSTEIEEILALCDRVMIFRDKQIFEELDQSAMTMSNIIHGMFGDEHGEN